MASLLVAAIVGAAVVVTGRGEPLPALVAVTAFLVVAVEGDVRRMRIPNWLTFPALAAALLFGTWNAGLQGLLSALAGSGIALAVLVLPFAMRWLGGGDVKAVMALGAVFGPAAILGLLWWMVVVGGVLALLFLAARRGLGEMLRRWILSLKLSLLTRQLMYVGPEPGSASSEGLPFAISIGLGVAAYQQWGMSCF